MPARAGAVPSQADAADALAASLPLERLLVAALAPPEDPRSGAYLDVFQALAAAVDVAESLSRRRDT